MLNGGSVYLCPSASRFRWKRLDRYAGSRGLTRRCLQGPRKKKGQLCNALHLPSMQLPFLPFPTQTHRRLRRVETLVRQLEIDQNSNTHLNYNRLVRVSLDVNDEYEF